MNRKTSFYINLFNSLQLYIIENVYLMVLSHLVNVLFCQNIKIGQLRIEGTGLLAKVWVPGLVTFEVNVRVGKVC